MKERPILFSAPMVQAILAGRKTMTRRVVKRNESGRVSKKGHQWHIDDPDCEAACPYGQVGDRLWLRESWRTYASLDHLSPRDINQWAAVEYLAGGSNLIGQPTMHGMGRCRPSIFMPRWASRTTLEVTGVKVERLQDIAEKEAKKEGIIELPFAFQATKLGPTHDTAKDAFQQLWDSINGKTYGKSWADNPYVWAVEFE